MAIKINLRVKSIQYYLVLKILILGGMFDCIRLVGKIDSIYLYRLYHHLINEKWVSMSVLTYLINLSIFVK